MLINVPIESLEERYSAQWNVGFPAAFARLGVEHRTVHPELGAGGDRISRGQFLDVVRTNEFKSRQLTILMQMVDRGEIKDNDVILVHDLWYPGLEMLFYVRDGLGGRFKIAGLLHAGTYDPHDFLTQRGMARWAGRLETSWWSEVDAIFVATKFHQHLLTQKRILDDENKIQVTGFPLFEPPPPPLGLFHNDKQDIVVFPHRLAPEKQPYVFDQITALCRSQMPGWQFVKTKDVCTTKPEYHALLLRSKIAVSCALQETWGIAQQEALFRNCVPVVPNRLSYVELYEPEFRYKSVEEAARLIITTAAHWEPVVRGTAFKKTQHRCFTQQEAAIGNMLTYMRNRGWAV